MAFYQMHAHYSADDARRESLYPLFETVFGIPVDVLRDFYRRGFWNPTYTPYSLFDGDRAIANTSMFAQPLCIDGQIVAGAGIQSVMTHPDYRGRGHMKRLFAAMLADLDQQCEISLLYTSSPKLYEDFGFRSVPQYLYESAIEKIPKQTGRLLVPWDFSSAHDLRLAEELFRRHTPVSHAFSLVAYRSSFFLHMYNERMLKMVSCSEDLRILVVSEVRDNTLFLYDVIGEALPPLEELCSRIPGDFERICFFFYPDRFQPSRVEAKLREGSEQVMVRGNITFDRTFFSIPITAAF